MFITCSCSFAPSLLPRRSLYASVYVFSLFATSRYDVRLVSSKMPKYPKRRMVYIDCIMFFFACLRVLLKEPRLISAFVCLNLAFSSYFSFFEVKFSVKTSMSSVSSCVLVTLLFLASILAIGSSIERLSQF